MFQYNTIEEALEDLRQGRMILCTDDPDRENEGDLICAAEFATTENVNFMATHAKGLICMPMSLEYVRKLQFPQMVTRNTDNHETAFTVSIDHVDTTTGISAAERSITAMKCVDPDAKPEDFRRPGHMFPLLAKEHGVSYLFEASVGGGIPILRPLTSCLAANELTQVTGILNGTTNYILTRMIKAGLTFEQALKEAQDNGYAEKDPTADVDGHDACRKICILAALSFGQHVYPDQVPTEGIRNVTLEDVAYADSCGYKIKLLGRCIRQPEGKVCAFVAPHLVPASNPLSGVEDVFNAIAVTGNAIGDVMFYGRGAGKLPTASAVVADVIDIAKDLKRDHRNEWGPGAPDLVVSPDIITSRWYVRAQAPVDQVRLACGDIQLLARAGAPAGEVAFLTAAMTEPQIKDKLQSLDVRSRFRVLD